MPVRHSSLPGHDSWPGLHSVHGRSAIQQVAQSAVGGKAVTPTFDEVLGGARHGGQALDADVLSQLQPTLGVDLSRVRVHADSRADVLSRAVGARAFASGRDIFFREGEYELSSQEGRELLVHEVTHVVQQRGTSPQGKLTLNRTGDDYEREADRMAARVVRADSPFHQMTYSSWAAPAWLPQRSMANRLQELPHPGKSGRMGVAPVPICLGEAPDGLVQRDVEFTEEEGGVITGEPGSYNTRANNTLWNVAHRAAINALTLGQETQSACEAFADYANEKIADLEGEVSAGDVVGVLLEVALAPIGGAITGRITNSIARELASAVLDQITDAIQNRAEEAASNADDVEALRGAVRSIAQGARDGATNMNHHVHQAVDPLVSEMINKLNSGRSLTSDEEEFLGTFWMAPPDILDENLEALCGVPQPTSVREIHFRIFEGLVREFERLRVWKTASLYENLLSSNVEVLVGPEAPGTHAHEARRRAREATAERRRRLEGRDR